MSEPERLVDFELVDHTRGLYRLSEHLEDTVVVVFNRGDW